MKREQDPAQRPVALSQALKRNRRRLVIRKIIAELHEAGIEVTPGDFLGLEEAEELVQAFYDRFRRSEPVRRDAWPATARSQVAQLLSDLASRVAALPIALFRSRDDLTTAVVIPAHLALMQIPESVQRGEEDLSLTTIDLKHGLRLELNWYNDEGEYAPEGIYELRRWGIFAE
jgi:hypothetical protein